MKHVRKYSAAACLLALALVLPGCAVFGKATEKPVYYKIETSAEFEGTINIPGGPTLEIRGAATIESHGADLYGAGADEDTTTDTE